MKLFDFAKARAKKIHEQYGEPYGTFTADPAKTGDHVLVNWENGRKKLRCLMTIEEAKVFRKHLAKAIFKAQHIHRKVHGLVLIGWCKPSGEAVGDYRAEARILQRFDDMVRIEVLSAEPLSGRDSPKDGFYWIDGWREGHDRIQAGWRIISDLKRRKP